MKQNRTARSIQAELEFIRRMSGDHNLNQPRGGWPERLTMPLVLGAIYTASAILSVFVLSGLYHLLTK